MIRLTIPDNASPQEEQKILNMYPGAQIVHPVGPSLPAVIHAAKPSVVGPTPRYPSEPTFDPTWSWYTLTLTVYNVDGSIASDAKIEKVLEKVNEIYAQYHIRIKYKLITLSKAATAAVLGGSPEDPKENFVFDSSVAFEDDTSAAVKWMRAQKAPTLLVVRNLQGVSTVTVAGVEVVKSASTGRGVTHDNVTVVSALSNGLDEFTVAHELGHMLGHKEHTKWKGLMCWHPWGVNDKLSGDQIQQIRSSRLLTPDRYF